MFTRDELINLRVIVSRATYNGIEEAQVASLLFAKLTGLLKPAKEDKTDDTATGS